MLATVERKTLKITEYCSFDWETTGLNPYRGDRGFAYSIGHRGGDVEVFRLDGTPKQNQIAQSRLEDFWKNTSIAKVGHNIKFDIGFTIQEGIHIPPATEIHDTMIMSQLLRNLAPSHALDYLCWELGGISRETDVQVRTMAKALGGYQNVPHHLMDKYQELDAFRCMLLFDLWFEKIKNDPVYNDYKNEIQLISVLQRMEQFGIDVCMQEATALIEWLEDELEKVQDETFELFNEYINLNSTDQVQRLLYRRLVLPVLDYTKDNKPSTGKNELLKLRAMHPHPAIDLVFRQRSYQKGIAIIKGYIELADKNNILHANLKGNHARTGRLASENPNLMNVAKEGVQKNPYPVPARRCYKVRKGQILRLVDYAGIELRLIIEIAKSIAMMNLLKRGEHPHVKASEIFYGKWLPKEFQFINKASSKKLYGSAKNAHFALAYGAGLPQFADTLNLTIEQAKIGFEAYQKEFPEIAFLTNSIGKKVTDNGYVVTPFGRKLYVPIDKAYSGLNYLIQGTAAGILKRALVRVDKYTKTVWNDLVRIVMPIHDEIVLSFSRDLQYASMDIMKDISLIMVDMHEINVPLEVEWKETYSTWDRAKEVEVDYRKAV